MPAGGGSGGGDGTGSGSGSGSGDGDDDSDDDDDDNEDKAVEDEVETDDPEVRYRRQPRALRLCRNCNTRSYITKGKCANDKCPGTRRRKSKGQKRRGCGP